MKTVPTWGYSTSGPQIFHLPPGGVLPDGWHDSPAKVPGGMAKAANGAGVPSPVHQELAETKRLLDEALAENTHLKALVAEMEAALVGDVPQPPLPPAEADTPREVVGGTLAAGSAIDRLRQHAQALGIKVDMRWGAERLQREIEAVPKA